MTSTASSPKRIEKVSSDNIVISFDLLTNLTYMATLAAAELPRELILQRTGEQRTLQTSVFFEQVNLLAQRLGVEYTRALQLVADKARAPNVKSLLLRFSNTIASGESEHAFIREESRIEGQRYANEYARSIENLKKWTDAYAALMVSVTLIVVVALVSTLLGALGQSFILMVGATMFLINSGGVYIILRSAPYEQTTYDGDTDGPPNRARARFLLRTVGFVGAMTALGVGLFFGVGWALIVLAISIAPSGFFARRDDKNIVKLDEEVPTFIRSLGTIAGATGATLTSALNSLDMASMPALQPYLVNLRTRLSSRLPTDLSWERFKTETGNELLRRSTVMLVDGVELGASGEEVGEIASSYASRIAELRQVRALTAGSFTFLVIPMHAAMSGLLLLILSIVKAFDERLQMVAGDITGQSISGNAGPSTEMFARQDLTLITGMITMVILVLTVSNSLAPKFASGGNHLKIAYYFSIMCLISGINMLLVPQVAGSLLSG